MIADGPAIRALVRRSPPLDVNSTYTYLLLATYFSGTSVVATSRDELMGFISGFLEPTDPSVLFIWQVVVHPDMRGQGIARRMLSEVLTRPLSGGVRFLEATVTPSNDASSALFHRLAVHLGARLERRVGFPAEYFGDESHEPEELVRIGPFAAQGSVT